MGDVFPELKQHEAHIRDTIAAEETSFGKTLLHVRFLSWEMNKFFLMTLNLFVLTMSILGHMYSFSMSL